MRGERIKEAREIGRKMIGGEEALVGVRGRGKMKRRKEDQKRMGCFEKALSLG